MKNSVKWVLFPFIFLFGRLVFFATGKTTKLSYAAFRFLFVGTNGRVNDFVSSIISIFHPPKTYPESKTFKSKYALNELVESIEKDGYFELDITLSPEQIENLVKFAEETPCHCLDISKNGVHYLPEKVLFNEHDAKSPRYQLETKDVLSNITVQQIISDPFFHQIASSYLKCNPILDVITMWWSVPFDNKATAQAAQMYHFDMDRFKFLKFFFYLTDVHTDNGPHCYIKNSHHRLSKEIRQDRRLTDEELLNYYPKAAFKEFTGKKGTILAVDTRGLHKGKPLVSDKRLLFQFQFSNSLFGAPFEYFELNKKSPELQDGIQKNKHSYSLFKKTKF